MVTSVNTIVRHTCQFVVHLQKLIDKRVQPALPDNFLIQLIPSKPPYKQMLW